MGPGSQGKMLKNAKSQGIIYSSFSDDLMPSIFVMWCYDHFTQ